MRGKGGGGVVPEGFPVLAICLLSPIADVGFEGFFFFFFGRDK